MRRYGYGRVGARKVFHRFRSCARIPYIGATASFVSQESYIYAMRAKPHKIWSALVGGYWFVPSIMTLGAIALAIVMIQLDVLGYTEWVAELPWHYLSEPDGARAVLSTIAASMLTVAGVTFSITIVAIVYASSQFGPRLLTNFMQDHGNQFTLGAFIGTFIYCLLVLRTIRQVDDGNGFFVPQLSLLVGIALALASVGVFIYYIHHVPESIHISNVTASVGKQILHKIEHLYPEMIGSEPPLDEEQDEVDLPDPFYEDAVAIEAGSFGYVQFIDEEGIIRHASEHDLVLRIMYRPGDFVMKGKVLAYAWPSERVRQQTSRRVNSAFAWGQQRTQGQDLLFLANELVEIAARALSPALNDPVTAMTCMDWLSSGLRQLSQQEPPSTRRYGDDGRLRLIAQPVTFEQFAYTAYGQLRPYVSKDMLAALHMMKTIADVMPDLEKEAHRQVLLRHARLLLKEGEDVLDEAAASELADRYHVLVRLQTDPSGQTALASKYRWLSGSG